MAEIETKTIEPMAVMSLSFTGSYNQTAEKLDELVAWVLRAGRPYSGPPMAIYYDDPEKVAEADLRAEALVPMGEQCDGGDDIVRKELPGAEVATALHQGAYAGIGAVYKEIFGWIAENGYRYVEEAGTREIFHKVLGEVDAAAEFLTEIQVPIEKV